MKTSAVPPYVCTLLLYSNCGLNSTARLFSVVEFLI